MEEWVLCREVEGADEMSEGTKSTGHPTTEGEEGAETWRMVELEWAETVFAHVGTAPEEALETSKTWSGGARGSEIVEMGTKPWSETEQESSGVTGVTAQLGEIFSLIVLIINKIEYKRSR